MITQNWKGPPPPERDVRSLWSKELGGIIDKSHINILTVNHARHWDKTPNTRGLCKPPRLDQYPFPDPVTMVTPLRERLDRSALPVDSSPSSLYASDEYVNDLSLKRTKSQKLRESSFRIGRMVGDTIQMCSVDHPSTVFHFTISNGHELSSTVARVLKKSSKFS